MNIHGYPARTDHHFLPRYFECPIEDEGVSGWAVYHMLHKIELLATQWQLLTNYYNQMQVTYKIESQANNRLLFT